MRTWIVTALWVVFFTLGKGQAPNGLISDPYGTFPGVYWQPAAGLSSPYGWEFHLGAQGNVDNNYIFIREAAGLSLMTQIATADMLGIISGTQTYMIDDRSYDYDYFDDGAERFGRVELSLTGPSISFRLGSAWRIGLGTRFRAVGDARNIDTQLSFYTYDALPFDSRFTIQPGGGQFASWGEINLNLARRFEVGAGELGIGVNLKYLLPTAAARVRVEGQTTITKVSNSSFGLQNSNIQVAVTGDLLNDQLGEITGNGVGIDLGLTYGFGDLIGPDGLSQFTLGVAVLDLGKLSYNERSEQHRFSSGSDRIVNTEDYAFEETDLSAIPSAIEQFNADVNDEASTRGSLEGNGFNLGLPTRSSISFSYQLDESLGFDGRVLFNTPLGENALRGNQVATAGVRYTKWWYGGGLNVNMHEFRQLNLGMYLRAGPFYLGSDRILGTLLKRDVLAAGDFYAGFRLHAFRRAPTKSKRRKRRGKGSRYNECYTF